MPPQQVGEAKRTRSTPKKAAEAPKTSPLCAAIGSGKTNERNERFRRGKDILTANNGARQIVGFFDNNTDRAESALADAAAAERIAAGEAASGGSFTQLDVPGAILGHCVSVDFYGAGVTALSGVIWVTASMEAHVRLCYGS